MIVFVVLHGAAAPGGRSAIGGAGATAALGAYRPYFLLAGTAALLGAGFYFTYRKPRGADMLIRELEEQDRQAHRSSLRREAAASRSTAGNKSASLATALSSD